MGVGRGWARDGQHTAGRPHLPLTQAARVGAAVLFAPLADRLIDAVRTSLRLRSKKAAFGVCVLALCALASVVLVGKTATWV